MVAAYFLRGVVAWALHRTLRCPMLTWLACSLALAGSFEVVPDRTNPLVIGLPAIGSTEIYDVRETTDLGDWGAEAFTRSTMRVEVGPGDRGGRTLTSTVQQLDRLVETDFGLVGEAELAAMPTQGPGLLWSIDRQGALIEVRPIDDGGVQSAVLSAMLAAVSVPVPPRKARPGEQWQLDQRLDLPLELDEGRSADLHLHVQARSRFVGWTSVDGRWLARIEVDGVIELQVLLHSPDLAARGGGLARVSAIVVVDPTDGMPVWSSRRTRILMAAGDRDLRPKEVGSVSVLRRVEG